MKPKQNKTFKDRRLEELGCILQSSKSIQDLSKRLEQFLSETIDMAEKREKGDIEFEEIEEIETFNIVPLADSFRVNKLIRNQKKIIDSLNKRK